ncbi:MAG: hypothetical protein ACE5OQ_05075 [Woeseia sp.]
MRPGLLVICLAVAAVAACSSRDVRQLSSQEIEVIGRMRDALAGNRAEVYRSLDDLRDNGNVALEERHSLAVNLSKAKLLESMKSPWVNPHPDLAATQKEVALYQLYALAEAEHQLLAAMVSQRAAAVRQVRRAYARLITDAGRLIELQKTILAHLNQPTHARILAASAHVATELRAFESALAAADDPRLREIARNVDGALTRYQRIRQQLEDALEVAAELRKGAR